MVVVLVMTDGRDELLAQTIESFREMVQGPVTRLVIHTDNGTSHVEYLQGRYPNWEVIGGPRLGFGGAINRAWTFLSKDLKEMFLFHMEDDFTFNKPVSLVDMAAVLIAHPHIAQMALRRQPWNEEEKAAGGVVETWPDSYEDKEWEGLHWLEHRLFITTNPSLFHIERCASGWPTGPQSEEEYSRLVFSNPETVAAYWGTRDSHEWVHHNGERRAGKGY